MPPPPSVLCYASLPATGLDRARTLFADLAQIHPDWRFAAVITDGDPLPETDDGFDIVAGTRSGFMDEACRAGAADIIVHIDPRAAVTASLSAHLARLEGADILLLARFSEPSPDRQGMLDLDLHIARTGTFNVGLLAVRSTGEGPAFAAWWADRVSNYPSDFAPPGYADQRWCDLAPGLFDRMVIARHHPDGLALPLDRDA
jgi:hypothetical protein